MKVGKSRRWFGVWVWGKWLWSGFRVTYAKLQNDAVLFRATHQSNSYHVISTLSFHLLTPRVLFSFSQQNLNFIHHYSSSSIISHHSIIYFFYFIILFFYVINLSLFYFYLLALVLVLAHSLVILSIFLLAFSSSLLSFLLLIGLELNLSSICRSGWKVFRIALVISLFPSSL